MTEKKMNPIIEAMVVFSIFALTGWGMYACLTGIVKHVEKYQSSTQYHKTDLQLEPLQL